MAKARDQDVIAGAAVERVALYRVTTNQHIIPAHAIQQVTAPFVAHQIVILAISAID
ncbi:hypothetical protein D3C85_1368770 [compost metagenome]